jgi:hypothetical protein
MAKLTLTDLTQLASNETSAVSAINANNTLIEAALENTLSRDGTTPNTMSADIDLNGNDLLNVGSLGISGGISLNDIVGYAEEWANKAEDSLVSVAAGGDGSTEYSSLHHAAKASASASAASTSASNASTSASNASTSETNAQTYSNQAQAAAQGWAAVTTLTTGTNNIETTDARTFYIVDASGGTVTINLPAIGTNDGLSFHFQASNVDNAITIARDGSDYINGSAADYTGLTTVAQTLHFVADDNTPDNWLVANIDVVQAASTSQSGISELAIASEVNTGTDATRTITPDALAGSNYGTAVVQILVFDDATDCATGDGAGDVFFRVPSTANGFDLVGVAAQCQTAGTTGTMDVQIHNVTQAADMLTTKLTIDSAETDSSTAATAAVIDTANDDVATGDQIRIDVDAVHTTAAKGLLVELQFRLP